MGVPEQLPDTVGQSTLLAICIMMILVVYNESIFKAKPWLLGICSFIIAITLEVCHSCLNQIKIPMAKSRQRFTDLDKLNLPMVGLILGLSQFFKLLQMPYKPTLDSKVDKNDLKIIILLYLSKSVNKEYQGQGRN